MDQNNPLPTPSQSEPAAPAVQVEGSSAPVGINRRALLRGGAAASPILLTFASNPVAATNGGCVVASSFVSASVYASRNPSHTTIKCVPKTAQNHCDEAKNNSQTNCNWNPHNKKVSDYVSGTVTCGSWTHNTDCYWVYRNGGTGLAASGDTAILQRVLALSYGAPTIFTTTYCSQIWNARNSTAALAALVNDGANTWDQARLLAWLDYSANGVTF
jgi:hypothetical protein